MPKSQIADTGCSRTITYNKSDYINYEPYTGEVEGLVKYDIVGIGTVKYTLVTDSGDTTDIIIKDAIYIPTRDVRLLSIQQYIQQTLDLNSEAGIWPSHLTIRWGEDVKCVPYNGTINLLVLCTSPGDQRATTYISKHLTPWNKAYLLKDKKSVLWDNKLDDGSIEILPPELESTVPPDKSKLNKICNQNTPHQTQMIILTSMSTCQKCIEDSTPDLTPAAEGKC